MLPADAPDHRHSSDTELFAALRAQDPLALAEAYHRCAPAAHAIARRLMSATPDIERLLRAVFSELWVDPPDTVPLEGWARRRTWDLGAEELRDRGAAPASPSAAGLLPDLPAPDVRYLDAAERALTELGEAPRTALLRAHDQGVPSADQGPAAPRALQRALRALAGPDVSSVDREALESDPCDDLPGLGDWCLGLVSPEAARRIEDVLEERQGCAALARAMRRGRRRVEGLPATPDLGNRILVLILTDVPGRTPAAPPPSAPPAPPPAPTQPPAPEPVADDVDVDADEGLWAPQADTPEPASAEVPPDTAELRLSDILGEDDETLGQVAGRRESWAPGAEDDRFGEDTGPLSPVEAPDAPTRSTSLIDAREDAADEYPEEELVTASSGGVARLMAWLVPIIAGGIVGLILANLLF